MTLVTISDKGQITLPAAMRRRLGLRNRSRVEVEVRGDEVVVRPAKSVRDVYGILHEFAKGKSADWETVRDFTERAVAEEVANEGR